MKRALVFRGGWDGHQPVQTSDFIAAELRKRDMEVDLFNDQECLLQPGLEEKYDVIIPVSALKKTGDRELLDVMESLLETFARR